MYQNNFLFLKWQLTRLGTNSYRKTYNIYEYIVYLYWKGFIHTTEMKKAKAGFLIKDIFDRLKSKALSQLSPDRTLWIYSAHDNTILILLEVLNLYEVETSLFLEMSICS